MWAPSMITVLHSPLVELACLILCLQEWRNRGIFLSWGWNCKELALVCLSRTARRTLLSLFLHQVAEQDASREGKFDLFPNGGRGVNKCLFCVYTLLPNPSEWTQDVYTTLFEEWWLVPEIRVCMYRDDFFSIRKKNAVRQSSFSKLIYF